MLQAMLDYLTKKAERANRRRQQYRHTMGIKVDVYGVRETLAELRKYERELSLKLRANAPKEQDKTKR